MSPAKRKKSDGQSAVNGVKAKKSKAKTKDKAVAAGGDDSDSDSSLDVEKWKTLLLQMTGRWYVCCVCEGETHTEYIVCVKALDEVVGVSYSF